MQRKMFTSRDSHAYNSIYAHINSHSNKIKHPDVFKLETRLGATIHADFEQLTLSIMCMKHMTTQITDTAKNIRNIHSYKKRVQLCLGTATALLFSIHCITYLPIDSIAKKQLSTTCEPIAGVLYLFIFFVLCVMGFATNTYLSIISLLERKVPLEQIKLCVVHV